MLGDLALDLVDGNRTAGLLLQDVAQDVLDRLVGQGTSAEGRKRCHAEQRTLKAADVRLDAVGEVFEDMGRQTDLQAGRLFAQNSETRFHVRRLEFGGEAPLEA